MDRIAAARERLEAVRTLARQAGEAGPPCSECRYKTLLGTCGNPAYVEMTFEPASGRLIEHFDTPVSKARAQDGLCGAEAILFEPQIPPVVVGKAIVSGSWTAFRLVIFGAALLLFIGWLLR